MHSAEQAALRNIRIDQVGALRAPELLEAFEKRERGDLSEPVFFRMREDAIGRMIQKQESIGLPVVTDGELRRRNFQDSFYRSVDGLENPRRAPVGGENRSMTPYTRTESAGEWLLRAAKRLELVRNVPLEEVLASDTFTTAPVKVTLINPDRIVDRFDRDGSRGAYRDADDFLADVVAIQRKMIEQLVAGGCRYIQIDAPGYTAYVDEISLAKMKARGDDPDTLLDRSIAADNAIIEGFDGVVFGLHICRGGARTIDPSTGKVAPQWHREGHYDAMAERLFTQLKYQRLLLEYDSDRAGGFEPLRFVQKGAIAVLGVVTTKNSDVETMEYLEHRVEDASRFLPLEQLALSPQCGFGGYRKVAVSEEIQWRKFDVIVAAANSIWK